MTTQQTFDFVQALANDIDQKFPEYAGNPAFRFGVVASRLCECLGALEAIAALGGNLPDDRLETASGPNDARTRGVMYTTARSIARDQLRLLTLSNAEARRPGQLTVGV